MSDTFTFTVSATEGSGGAPLNSMMTVNISAEAVAALARCCMESRAYSVSPLPTLTSALDETSSVVSISSAAGLSAGMGLMIDSEVVLIASDPIENHPVSIARGMLGTPASSHASGATCTALVSGGLLYMLRLGMTERLRQIMQQYPGPAVTAAQAAINAALAGAVI